MIGSPFFLGRDTTNPAPKKCGNGTSLMQGMPCTTWAGASIWLIARAAAVLRALKDRQTGLSLGQIAERVGLPRSTVQRIVAALIDERLLMATRAAGVRLGPELQSLAEAARYGTVELCRRHLNALMLETRETVELSALRGGQMVFQDQAQGSHRRRAVSLVGEHFPLTTTTANGRAALAILTEPEAETQARAEGHCPIRPLRPPDPRPRPWLFRGQ